MQPNNLDRDDGEHIRGEVIVKGENDEIYILSFLSDENIQYNIRMVGCDVVGEIIYKNYPCVSLIERKNMPLYLLKPNHIDGDDPWIPWYDKVFGFVIRAITPEIARIIADKAGGDETIPRRPWLDERYSSCVELTIEGEEGLIIKEMAAS